MTNVLIKRELLADLLSYDREKRIPAERHLYEILASQSPLSANTGHGHVAKRPDGNVTRCGGPSICRICQQEAAALARKPAPEVEAVEAASWNPPETTPKNRHILANCGWPWPVVAMWSDYAECWVIAMQEGNVCDGKSDPGFITEHERELIGWMEMPALPPRTK